MIQIAQVLSFLLVISACSSSKVTEPNGKAQKTKDCNTIVTAKDFTGLDGCKLLLVTTDGKKFLLGRSFEDKKIEAGKVYKIGYEVVQGQLSACMAEDAMIFLNCLEEIEPDRPELRDCYTQDDVMEIPFLKKIIEKNQPQRIIRHAFRGGAAYSIYVQRSRMLFDCQGNNMCEDLGKSFTECFEFFKTDFGKSKIVYTGEGQKE